MTFTMTDRSASEKSINYLTDLASSRPWHDALNGREWETAFDALGNVGNPDPKLITQREASAAIAALLKIRPPTTATVDGPKTSGSLAGRDRDQLTQALTTLPLSRYALPRVTEPGTWDFFEVVERKNGVRYVNRLLGAPGDWNREHLTSRLQLHAARHIAEDPRAAAFEYARQHGRCSCCNAKLSDPKSIATSMGPVCRKRFGL